MNCDVGGVSKRLEREQHFIALDELANLLDRLRRRRRVVVRDQVDLASIDAAAVVDHSKIGGLHLADHRD